MKEKIKKLLEHQIADYVARNPRSRRMAAEGRRFLPGGNTRTGAYIAPFPPYAERGEGVYLWDSNDKKYLDVTCGLAVTSLGHSHPEISEVIYNQSKTLIHTTNAFVIEQQGLLAERLCQLSGM